LRSRTFSYGGAAFETQTWVLEDDIVVKGISSSAYAWVTTDPSVDNLSFQSPNTDSGQNSQTEIPFFHNFNQNLAMGSFEVFFEKGQTLIVRMQDAASPGYVQLYYDIVPST